MKLQIDEKDKEKILKEISDSQTRILNIFVPTILAIGLISIADKENFALVTLLASFSILFASSLYISSLSYKIFRNATFLNALNSHNEKKDDGMIHWERAFSMFLEKTKPPKIIGYETKTIATIFIMFSIVFAVMFFDMNAYLSLSLGAILIFISIRMLLIPSKTKEYYEVWQDVIKDYDKKEK